MKFRTLKNRTMPAAAGLLEQGLRAGAVATLIFLAAPSFATQCAITIQADDAMRFTPDQIDIPASCQDFTVKLTHVGRLPKAAMGHNWVLVKASDLEGVARTGMLAGASNDYIDPADKRVIAHTGLIGSGDSSSVTFEVKQLQAGQRYTFLCSFAGHSPIMQGTLRLKESD